MLVISGKKSVGTVVEYIKFSYRLCALYCVLFTIDGLLLVEKDGNNNNESAVMYCTVRHGS